MSIKSGMRNEKVENGILGLIPASMCVTESGVTSDLTVGQSESHSSKTTGLLVQRLRTQYSAFILAFPPYTNIKTLSTCAILSLLLIQSAIPSIVHGDDKGPEFYRVPESCSPYVAEVEKYAWNPSVIIKIMRKESFCDSSAVGDRKLEFGHGRFGMSCGLLQVRILPGRSYDCDDMKDPVRNIAEAFGIYEQQGYKAWSTYSPGME